MQDFRGGNDYDYKYIIPNGGWHFSFLGDKDSVKQKIQAYAHAEFNNDTFTNDKNIEEAIEQGRDVFKRDLHFHKVQIDSTYPKFVQDNVNYYLQKGLISKRYLTKEWVEGCIAKAERKESNIDKGVLALEGMSSDRQRHLINNICSLGGLNYLEVGAWRGATSCAAMSNNKLATATIIDNFSEFAIPNEEQAPTFVHPKDEMVRNFGNFSSQNQIRVLEKDFFTIDLSSLPKIDVFYYDGNHSQEAQYQALKYALPALADLFVFIVDDYHWPIVQEPTKKCIQDLIESGDIIPLHEQFLESETPPKDVWPDGWNHLFTNLIGRWRNGLYIGLFKKKQFELIGIDKNRKGIVKPKVFDCFSFYNELDLLEIRLNELDPFVDFFVLSEMRQTHSGKPKPLYFEENKERFAKFLPKIIHVVPPDIETNDPWVREHYQRDYIKIALEGCQPLDIIILSDLDEIPRGSKIAEYKSLWTEFFWQKQYSYYLNFEVGISPVAPGTFSRITRWKNLKNEGTTLTALRYKELADSFGILDGGWHFSWMGGGEKIADKLEAWAHQEFNKPENLSPKKIEHFINSGKEHLGREGVGETKIVPIDSTFPKYVQNYQSYLTEIGLIGGVYSDPTKVAIIMPYYNDTQFLTKSVGAILGQTFQNWELFIVDDGSDSDKSAFKILASHPKVFIWQKANGGPASARNSVLTKIQRENWDWFTHIAFCDSDDIWDSNYLESQLANMGTADIVYCSVRHRFDNGQEAIPHGIPDPEVYPGREFMLKTPFIYISSVICRRYCLESLIFDSNLDSIEDLDMWLSLDEAGYIFKKNPQKLLTYTVKTDSNMASKRTDNKTNLLMRKHKELV
jgi:beta-1,4-mannosyl-glycoprotein beta-1,4-N-acetylglucosaminyltransferase